MQIEDLPTWSQASSQAEFRWERPELPEQIIDNNIKQDQISWTNIKQHASNCIRTHTHTHTYATLESVQRDQATAEQNSHTPEERTCPMVGTYSLLKIEQLYLLYAA